jgi:hypothetical protein
LREETRTASGKYERITIGAKTFEQYQKIGPDYLASNLPIFKRTR